MKRSFLLLAFSASLSVLLLEAGLRIGVKLGLFQFRLPSHSMIQARNPVFVRDVNPDFGVWHTPDSTSRHVMTCFDVTNRSNSYGARDAERKLQSQRPRIVVLGDSMVEGYGVADAQRFTNVLERETDIEHLNFGTAGNFGTIQYYLLYKTLASRFSHSAVLIGLLPANDFWDNDYEYGKTVYANRYRPYLIGEYPNYRLVYYRASLEESTYRDREGWLALGERILAEFTYSYNAFVYFTQLAVAAHNPAVAQEEAERERHIKKLQREREGSEAYAGFYDYRRDQLDLVKYTFEQIKKLAGEREVIIALLPTGGDFKRYDPATTPPLTVELAKFAAEHGMTLVDLLPEMYRRAKDGTRLILPCDGHWGAQGHEVAAQVLRKELDPLYRNLSR